MTAEEPCATPENIGTSIQQIATIGDDPGEADLSTEQAGAQTAPWLPHPHGDKRRAPRGGGAPGPRAQAAECV